MAYNSISLRLRPNSLTSSLRVKLYNYILLCFLYEYWEETGENLPIDQVDCFAGFHAVDLDSASVNDLFIPTQVSLIDKFLSGCFC